MRRVQVVAGGRRRIAAHLASSRGRGTLLAMFALGWAAAAFGVAAGLELLAAAALATLGGCSVLLAKLLLETRTRAARVSPIASRLDLVSARQERDETALRRARSLVDNVRTNLRTQRQVTVALRSSIRELTTDLRRERATTAALASRVQNLTTHLQLARKSDANLRANIVKLRDARKALDERLRQNSERLRQVTEQLGTIQLDARERLQPIESSQAAIERAVSENRQLLEKIAGRSTQARPSSLLAALARRKVEHPTLSIAIPSYNRPEFLSECLESLEHELSALSSPAVEVWITDDASTDPDTFDVAADFVQRSDVASLVSNPSNLGLERNLLHACEPCRGDYILVLGNDDRLSARALETILSDLRRGEADVYLYDKSRITRDGAPLVRGDRTVPIELPPDAAHLFDSLADGIREQGILSTLGFISTVVFRRSALEMVEAERYLDLTMYPLAFLLLEAFGGSPFMFRNTAIVEHRTPQQFEKQAEAMGRVEEPFMRGGDARSARYFGTTLAASLQRVVDGGAIDLSTIAALPERLLTDLPLLEWVSACRQIDPALDETLDSSVVADADRLFAALPIDVRFDRGSIAHSLRTRASSPDGDPTERSAEGSRIICITGMHSSGTSSVARVVNLLGVDLGPPAEVGAPAPAYNSRGLWEFLPLTRVSDGVLKTLGATWDHPPAMAAGWHLAPDLDQYRARAREIVDATFGDTALWGWKDPRCSLLLPFWEDVLGPVDVVAVVRNPVDIASSLVERDGMPWEAALALWEVYAQGLLDVISTHRAAVVVYEDLWKGPEVFGPLARFLGHPGAHLTDAFRDALSDWVDADMWHQREGHAARDLTKLTVGQRDLYAQLLAHATS